MKQFPISVLTIALILLISSFATISVKAQSSEWGTPKQLTFNQTYDVVPVISGDGNKIVFHSGLDGDNEIFFINSDGTGLKQLTFNILSDVYPSINYDGNTIAFISGTGISIINSDGTGLRQLVNNAGQPSISGNGAKVAFIKFDGIDYEIFVINTDGNEEKQLTFNSAEDSNPSINYDGSKVIFVGRGEDNRSRIFIINSDGTGLKQLSFNILNNENDFKPSISADGNKIVFYSSLWPEEGGDVFVVNSDGTGLRRLTYSGSSRFASISADGERITGIMSEDGEFKLFIINWDETGYQKLTGNLIFNTVADTIPSISGNGDKIAFSSNKDGDFEVFLIQMDGVPPVPSLDNTLVVYIGTHPDDIDIGMSGSLYKYDVNTHPILWIVVTDGGADRDEYEFESSKGWIANDGVENAEWIAPNGEKFYRGFYSEDLSRKRCGIGGSYQHSYIDPYTGLNYEEYDWRTRIDRKVGPSVVRKVQMSYPNPFDPLQRILYPDAGLGKMGSLYTSELAANLAYVIDETVRLNGYRKDLIYINSHAPEEVAENANEHLDHKITGNAVRKAIDNLHTEYGFDLISVTWYTIYNPIDPKAGYTRSQEDISPYELKKSELCKAVWETAFMDTGIYFDRSENYTKDAEGYWNDYPNDPGDYEYIVGIGYYPITPTISSLTITAASPVNILVIDPIGRRVGFNPSTQNPINEIPGAIYNGVSSQPQVVNISNPIPGNYQTDVYGYDMGSYTLTMESKEFDSSSISSQTVTGTATKGSRDIQQFSMSNAGSITVSIGEIPSVPEFELAVTSMASLIALALLLVRHLRKTTGESSSGNYPIPDIN